MEVTQEKAVQIFSQEKHPLSQMVLALSAPRTPGSNLQDRFSATDSDLIGLKRNFSLWSLRLRRVEKALLQGRFQSQSFPSVTIGDYHASSLKRLNYKGEQLQLTLMCRLAGVVWGNHQCPGARVVCAGRAAAHCCAAGAQLPHFWQNLHFFPPLLAFCVPGDTSAATLS